VHVGGERMSWDQVAGVIYDAAGVVERWLNRVRDRFRAAVASLKEGWSMRKWGLHELDAFDLHPEMWEPTGELPTAPPLRNEPDPQLQLFEQPEPPSWVNDGTTIVSAPVDDPSEPFALHEGMQVDAVYVMDPAGVRSVDLVPAFEVSATGWYRFDERGGRIVAVDDWVDVVKRLPPT
jgi:hypothetical protein